MRVHVCIILVIVGTALCLTTVEEWKTDVKNQYSLFYNYFKDRDFTALGSLFSEECVLMPPGKAEVKGREAAVKLFSSMADEGLGTIRFATLKVLSNKTRIATEFGYGILRTVDGTLMDFIRYLVLWKRNKGIAEIYTAIWSKNSSS